MSQSSSEEVESESSGSESDSSTGISLAIFLQIYCGDLEIRIYFELVHCCNEMHVQMIKGKIFYVRNNKLH